MLQHGKQLRPRMLGWVRQQWWVSMTRVPVFRVARTFTWKYSGMGQERLGGRECSHWLSSGPDLHSLEYVCVCVCAVVGSSSILTWALMSYWTRPHIPSLPPPCLWCTLIGELSDENKEKFSMLDCWRERYSWTCPQNLMSYAVCISHRLLWLNLTESTLRSWWCLFHRVYKESVHMYWAKQINRVVLLITQFQSSAGTFEWSAWRSSWIQINMQASKCERIKVLTT